MRSLLGSFERSSVLGWWKGLRPLARRLRRPSTTLRALLEGDGPETSGGRKEHVTLEIYPVVLELIRRLRPGLAQVKARSAVLGDQFERALISVPLNVAEGSYSRGRNRQARYHTACGSAREALACWETAQALGWVQALDPEIAALFQRVIGTLVRLAQPRP